MRRRVAVRGRQGVARVAVKGVLLCGALAARGFSSVHALEGVPAIGVDLPDQDGLAKVHEDSAIEAILEEDRLGR